MNKQTRLASRTADLIVIPLLLAMAISAYAFGAISRSADVRAAPIAIAVAGPAAGGIDHSVLLNDPDVLHAPNPAPMAVAAYDD